MLQKQLSRFNTGQSIFTQRFIGLLRHRRQVEASNFSTIILSIVDLEFCNNLGQKEFTSKTVFKFLETGYKTNSLGRRTFHTKRLLRNFLLSMKTDFLS